jgi:hypothetical protein
MKSNNVSRNIMRPTREDLLSTLVGQQKLTEDGKEWLVAALDPFHDYNHQIAGYPDTDVSQTVVSCYQYEMNLAAPAAIAVGATWDAHVFSLPTLSSFGAAPVYNETIDWGRITDPAPAVNTPLAPLMAYSVPTGNPMGFAIPVNANANVQVLPPTGSEDVWSGCSRLIACGFEVHNTTADIYKQGAVTTYRMPQSGTMNSCIFSNTNGTSFGYVTGKRFRAPPQNIAQANLLKGTRTWNARDGVYATVFQSNVTNPIKVASCEHQLYDPYPDPGQVAVVQGSPLIAGPGATPTTYCPQATKDAPFDTTGAMFTGLSSQTTLTVKARFYVERAPTWNESQLAVLASPSAGYDIVALQIYSQVINMLPPAVMVSENAKGDWWRAVLSVIRHVAAPLGLSLSGYIPGAGLVGTAASNIAGTIDREVAIASQAIRMSKKAKPKKVSQAYPKRAQAESSGKTRNNSGSKPKP